MFYGKKNILKNAGNQTISLWLPLYGQKNTMEVNGNQNHLVTNIFQNIFFYILKKVSNQIILAPKVFNCINQKN